MSSEQLRWMEPRLGSLLQNKTTREFLLHPSSACSINYVAECRTVVVECKCDRRQSDRGCEASLILSHLPTLTRPRIPQSTRVGSLAACLSSLKLASHILSSISISPSTRHGSRRFRKLDIELMECGNCGACLACYG